MEKVTIQIGRGEDLRWDTSKRHRQDFNTWKEVVDFAYRLSLIHQDEIRIEKIYGNGKASGSGHYFHPQHANRYLKSQ